MIPAPPKKIKGEGLHEIATAPKGASFAITKISTLIKTKIKLCVFFWYQVVI